MDREPESEGGAPQGRKAEKSEWQCGTSPKSTPADLLIPGNPFRRGRQRPGVPARPAWNRKEKCGDRVRGHRASALERHSH